jgi:aminoglycoside phosphotransferase (APT) family kinase protein
MEYYTEMVRSEAARVCRDLERYLAAAHGEKRRVSDLRPFGAGNSGFTFSALLGDQPAVLRLSPPGARIVGPADVGRQGRIMAAVGAGGAPAPSVIACSSEPVVDGRAFALMDLARGSSWQEARAQLGDQGVAHAALDAVRAVQHVDVAGLDADLPSFSPTEEIDRWAALLGRVPGELVSCMQHLRDALLASAPAQTERCLVHGDYHYGNLLFEQGQVSAVLDWEIASLGDPLVDAASLAVAAHRRHYAPEPNPTGGLDLPPTLIAQACDVDPDRFAWFVAQGCFKYAAIIGFNLELHRRGKRPDPIYELLQRTMTGLPRDGLAILRDGLDAAAVARECVGR